MKRILLSVAAAGLLMATGAQAQVQIQRQVLGSGATVATGNVVMLATLGQPVIGRVENPSNIVWQGFWTPLPRPAGVAVVRSSDAGRLQIVGVNPASVETDVTVTLSRAGNGSLLLVDALGRVVRPIVEGRIESGRTQHHLDVSDLPQGRYSLVLDVENERSTTQLVIVR